MTDIHEALAEIKAAGGPKPRAGRDPVNQPMVNSWVEAIGDTNPIYRDEDRGPRRRPPGNCRSAGHDSGVDDVRPERGAPDRRSRWARS